MGRHAGAHGQTLRHLISYGCLAYAAVRISLGDKCVGATRSAGFKSHWNFNRQAKRYSGVTARCFREEALLQFDEASVREALAVFDARQPKDSARAAGAPDNRCRQTETAAGRQRHHIGALSVKRVGVDG